MTTFLSGIQPSGLPHVGNYFGAIKQHIEAVAEGLPVISFTSVAHLVATLFSCVGLLVT